MEHIKLYNDFLLERAGYPDVISPYVQLIAKHCNKYIEEYFNRKGKFANYSINFKIRFNEIKNVVNKDKFIKYPIENINVNFFFKIIEDISKLAGSGTYYNIGNNIKIDTYYKKSKSGWIDNALYLKIDIGLNLPSNLKSYDFEKGQKLIISSIEHELTHSYNEFKGSDMYPSFYEAIQIVTEDYRKIKIRLKNSKPINVLSFASDILYPLYLSSKVETKAYIAEGDIRSANILKNFSADKISQTLLQYLKSYKTYNENIPIKIMNYLDDIGNRLVDVYSTSCRELNKKPKKSILKLKGMTFRQLLDYYEPIFRKHGEYMKRKINKLNYSKQNL